MGDVWGFCGATRLTSLLGFNVNAKVGNNHGITEEWGACKNCQSLWWIAIAMCRRGLNGAVRRDATAFDRKERWEIKILFHHKKEKGIVFKRHQLEALAVVSRGGRRASTPK